MTSLNRFFDSKNDFLKDFTCKSLGRVPQKSKKYDFFKLEILLPPMIINKNTELGRFVSVSKRFLWYFRDALSKSIFRLKIDFLKHFTRKSLGRAPSKSKKQQIFQIQSSFTPNDYMQSDYV